MAIVPQMPYEYMLSVVRHTYCDYHSNGVIYEMLEGMNPYVLDILYFLDNLECEDEYNHLQEFLEGDL